MVHKNLFILKCKHCQFEFLQNIAPYTIIDIVKGKNDKNSFWKREYQCPKCNLKTEPSIIVFDASPNNSNEDILERFKLIKEKDQVLFKTTIPNIDNSKLIILDDYKKFNEQP